MNASKTDPRIHFCCCFGYRTLQVQYLKQRKNGSSGLFLPTLNGMQAGESSSIHIHRKIVIYANCTRTHVHTYAQVCSARHDVVERERSKTEHTAYCFQDVFRIPLPREGGSIVAPRELITPISTLRGVCIYMPTTHEIQTQGMTLLLPVMRYSPMITP